LASNVGKKALRKLIFLFACIASVCNISVTHSALFNVVSPPPFDKQHPLPLQKRIMRKIIVTEFITLDGVIEAPGGNETPHPHGGWQSQYRAPETGQYKIDELASVDALLLGKNTYQQFARYWPTQTGEFADPINRYPKYVVSHSLQKAEWNNSHILRDVTKDVAALKETDGGDILVYGSAALVKALLHHDLVDELRLMMFPLSIGGGLKLFDDNRELKKFELKHAQTMNNGALILEYRPSEQ
jgi:dihydrofolate reductase